MGKKRMQSPSSINTYVQCPRKYYYIYKMKMPTSPSIHLVRGVVAHAALENLYTILPDVISDNYSSNLKVIVVELLKKYWAEEKENFDELQMPAQQLQDYFDETKAMVINQVELITRRIDAEIAKGMTFVEAFKKLTPRVEEEYLSWENYVRGFIDVIEEVDGRVRLMDYKTSKKAHITDAYRLQLAIYAMLYKEKHGKQPDEVGIYFLKYPEAQGGEMCLPVDEELIKHAQFMVEQIHASTDSDAMIDYKKNETPLCKWSTGQCDFYEYCFKGKPIPKEPLKSKWDLQKEAEAKAKAEADALK